ncbi:pseudouridine synthase [Jannaschia sp. S6380]|uniref:pseudouridine synthase n=1 Tax=Jannaschia sp. S6380 TaxID=2926408 RepID=UPI001FF2F4DD|nr:pseudouridine synthase [Jannaschia sp. S6380]MCK0167758.1 pseudouridine synthase [Jannaschia sp. S6380]
MTQNPDRPGDRIAKVIARAGLASRRDAETMVTDLRVKVNGRTVSNVATNIVPGDRVTVDGQPLPRAEGARLWLYHKPAGLVTSARDEKGRETVFDALPAELGRVLSVGRLDLNSEGLLLLTNDGDLKRQLELPSTGWLRRYRVRVNGTPAEGPLDRLRGGIEVEGPEGREAFAPMQVTLDRQQGANAWLTIGLREGRNREIRRALEAVELYVNRLIRVSYGPFQLGNLAAGAVEEVKPRILREQLGDTFKGELAESRKGAEMATDDKGDGKSGGKMPRKPRTSGDRLVDKGRGKPRGDAPKGGARGRAADTAEGRAERAARPHGPRTAKPPVTRNDGDGGRPARSGPGGARKPGDRKPWAKEGDRPARPGGDRKPGGKDDDARPKREDRRPGAQDRPKETKGERNARLRADTSVSLRKGGQKGRGLAKAKKPASTKRMRKPGESAED